MSQFEYRRLEMAYNFTSGIYTVTSYRDPNLYCKGSTPRQYYTNVTESTRRRFDRLANSGIYSSYVHNTSFYVMTIIGAHTENGPYGYLLRL